ncbi:Enhancer of mRNA-decapping protein 4 [Trichoplax sp. H2]|nr:Enhancer of mRNA-decapping protein 4 [Trichoplax sp. H2]|eukprot:RDD40081.1 Enhancer of mRNA-decapping protein 4 [Trichoplax sp. H2]
MSDTSHPPLQESGHEIDDVEDKSGEVLSQSSLSFSNIEPPLPTTSIQSFQLSQFLMEKDLFSNSDSNNVRQTIHLGGEEKCYSIYGNEIKIITKESSSCSNKVKFKTIVDYNWEQRYYYSNTIAVNENFVSYGLKGRNGFLVRVINRNDKNITLLLKGAKAAIDELAFANYFSNKLAFIDKAGNLFVRLITLEDGSLKETSLLHIEGWNTSKSSINRLIWNQSLYENTCTEVDKPGEISAPYYVAIASGNQVKVFDITALISNNVSSINIADLRKHYACISDDSCATIYDLALTAGGDTLATAGNDGTLKFWKISTSNPKEQMCVHLLSKPHDGAPIHTLKFCDDITTRDDSEAFWRFLITASKFNHEIKIWCTVDWTCLQTIRFTYPPEESNDGQLSPILQVALDRTASYLTLSDINRKMLYILKLHQNVEENLASATSISEFSLARSILQFSITRAKRLTSVEMRAELTESDEDDLEDDFRNTSSVDDLHIQSLGSVIEMTTVDTRSIQDVKIRFQPNPTEPTPLSSVTSGTFSAVFRLTAMKRFCTLFITQLLFLLYQAMQSIASNLANSTTSNEFLPNLEDSISMLSTQNSSMGTVTPLQVMSPDAFELPKSANTIDDNIDSIASLSKAPNIATEPKSYDTLDSQFVPKEQLSHGLNVDEISREKELETPTSTHDSAKKDLIDSNISESTVNDNDEEDVIIEDDEIGVDYGSAIDEQPLACHVATNATTDSIKGTILVHNHDTIRDNHYIIALILMYDVSLPAATNEELADRISSTTSSNSEGLPSAEHDHAIHVPPATSDATMTPDVSFTQRASEVDNLASDGKQVVEQLKSIIIMLNAQKSEINDLKKQLKDSTRSVVTKTSSTANNINNRLSSLQNTLRQDRQRFDQSQRTQQQQEYQQLDKIQVSVNQAQSNTVGRIEKIIKNEIKTTIIPSIVSNVSLIKGQLPRDNKPSDAVVKQSIRDLFLDKAVMQSVGDRLISSLKPNLISACRESFVNNLVPAFEKSCMEMIKQFDVSIQKGIQDYLKQTETYLEKSILQQQESTKAVFVNEFKNIELSLSQNQDVNRHKQLLQTMSTMHQTLADEFQKRLDNFKAEIAESVKHIVNEQLKNAGSATNTASSTPTLSRTDIIKKEVKALCDQGKVVEAFHKALHTSNVSIVTELCRDVSSSVIFTGNVCLLSQAMLLSLIQYLSVEMTNDIELKIGYLEDCIMALDFTDGVTKMHGAKILQSLLDHINRILLMSNEYKISSTIVKKLKVLKSLSTSHLK